MTLAKELKERDCAVTVVGWGVCKVKRLAKSFSQLDVHEMAFDTREEDVLFIQNWRPDLVLVDGYNFDSEFFELLGQRGLRFGVVDDNAETQANRPDFLLNQNPNGVREIYPREWVSTKFLLGMNYLLIRDEVINLISLEAVRGAPQTLVAIGGTDVRQLTPEIASSLVNRGHTVAVPNGQLADRPSGVGEGSGGSLRVFSSSKYAATLSSSTVAILGGGSSLYEAICLGVPVVSAIVADNQADIATNLLEKGLIHGLVDFRNGESEKTIAHLLDAHSKALEGPTPVLGLTDRKELAAGKRRVVEELLQIL